jgi:hypothetical protein
MSVGLPLNTAGRGNNPTRAHAEEDCAALAFMVGLPVRAAFLIYSSSPHAVAMPDPSCPNLAAPPQDRHTLCSAGEPRAGRFAVQAPWRFPGFGTAKHIRVPQEAS